MVTRPSPVQSIMSPFASPPTDTPVQPGFTPTTPVNESVAAPRRPKTRSAKQRDGFLALGLLIENATGQDYEAVLATWGAYLYRNGDVVSAGSLAQMTAIDESLYAGLGTFPVCPCTPNSDGTVQLTSYGHNGGPVAMQYSPADSIGIAVGFSESFWLGGFGQSDVYEFIAQVRAFANSSSHSRGAPRVGTRSPANTNHRHGCCWKS